MNELQIFTKKEFGSVRVVEHNGEYLFVAKDVCIVLDIQDHHQAIEQLDDDERGRCTVPTPGGMQELKVISE